MSTQPTAVPAPFQIPQSFFAALPHAAGQAIRNLCHRLLAFAPLNDAYTRMRDSEAAGAFCERALQALGVRFDAAPDDLKHIPTRGPLIVVANHPFGGLDGLILAALLQRVRPDVRLLANSLLNCIPELSACCFFVDPFGGRSAAARNRTAMRSAARWVAGGGALGLFPAGEVSHFTLGRRCVSDPPWSDSLARLALRTRATVVPVFFDGRNSSLFQLAGLLHPRLRTVLLPRELLRLRGETVRVEVGGPITPQRLARLFAEGSSDGSPPRQAAAQITEYLRLRTYILRGRAGRGTRPLERRPAALRRPEPIVPPASAAKLADEIAALPADQCLSASGPLRVLVGRASQLPAALYEIGRLREATFRLVGEGTGRGIDLDRFDPHYLHLFVWNAEQREIVGAYRMGPTDELLSRFGPAGLYTSTLFRYQRRLLDELDPALELGRSFVVSAYQRDYAPLLLLWKGIGRYVALNPRYRRLFGAVSISDEFQSTTRQLLMAFLKLHSFDRRLGSLVRAKNPPPALHFRDADERRLGALVNDFTEVEELVREIECSRRSVPVLLRQYLKLNAKLLGFNVDADFGDVLDGLVLVDLTTVERSILNRYLGKEGAASFLAFRQTAGEPSSPVGPGPGDEITSS